MNTRPIPVSQRAGLMLALREVVDALDRRLPQIERAGELRIVRDALVLRREAADRIEELQRADDFRQPTYFREVLP